MTGELFDGTLLDAAYYVFIGFCATAFVFCSYSIIDSIRNPPKKRQRHHPEW